MHTLARVRDGWPLARGRALRNTCKKWLWVSSKSCTWHVKLVIVPILVEAAGCKLERELEQSSGRSTLDIRERSRCGRSWLTGAIWKSAAWWRLWIRKQTLIASMAIDENAINVSFRIHSQLWRLCIPIRGQSRKWPSAITRNHCKISFFNGKYIYVMSLLMIFF